MFFSIFFSHSSALGRHRLVQRLGLRRHRCHRAQRVPAGLPAAEGRRQGGGYGASANGTGILVFDGFWGDFSQFF